MTYEQFVFWLSGFLTGACTDIGHGITPKGTKIIMDTLRSVKNSSIQQLSIYQAVPTEE
jgi:hypothetical protein